MIKVIRLAYTIQKLKYKALIYPSVPTPVGVKYKMYKSVLICIIIFVSVIYGNPLKPSDLSGFNDDDDVRSEVYRLSDDIYPTIYDVILYFDPNTITGFHGSVSIRVIPNVSLNEIVLHALEMEIDSIAVQSNLDSVNLFQSYTISTNDTQFLRIRLSRYINALEPHIINIEFKGKYAEDMFGVYLSTYESDNGPRRLVTSQLQPTYARRAFPCFDEPHLKAIFRTTIYAPAEFKTVKSNMGLRTQLLKNDVNGYEKYEFDDTPIMSSYLLAYLVSDFDYIENEADDIYRVPFRIYSRPNTQTTARFALEFGQKNMKALEEYTEFDYIIPKLDKVAVPDFAAGAMENWGLIIYREVALLVQEGVTSTSTLQNVGRIITHENMHQWFGNEVSPRSWTYTWLNEGFANFFENYATDLIYPNWRMMDQFVIAMQNVFQSDAVLGVNPMTHPVYTPNEVIGTFNAVAYQKSGSVIRMMQHFLTPEVFRQGLVKYLYSNQQSYATPADLYVSLQEALDESEHTIPYTMANIMDRWANQGGFPIITVTRNAAEAASVTVRQERYLTNREQTSNYVWHVPLNWVLSSDVNFTDTTPQVWLGPSGNALAIDIPDLPSADWYLFNKQQAGYYRVNYDKENWLALSRVLNSSFNTINLLNRAQLIDDGFNLARNGRLDYAVVFELAQYLKQETDYIPWAAANAAFSFLETILSDSNVYHIFQRYLLDLSENSYELLGFVNSQAEEHVTPFYRNIILNMNCRHGNQDCINTAKNFVDGSQPIHPDIQTTVYCAALRDGNAALFDRLWNMYITSTDASQQSILLNSLGCTTNIEKLDMYLNAVISDDSPVRDQDRHSVVVSVINSSPSNREIALDFVIENFDEIQRRVQGLSGTTNILNAFSRTLTTQNHLDKIEEFSGKYKFLAAEEASIDAIKENIAGSLTWRSEYYNDVDEWLRIYNSGTMFTASFTLILMLIIAIKNL